MKSQGEVGDKKKEFSKINCFHCHEYEHYATNCPQKKSSKNEPIVVEAGEALASQFELDFTLIACMANIVMRSMWYLDNGAPFPMTGNRDLYNALEEKDLKQNIDFGDDERYNATRIGTITF